MALILIATAASSNANTYSTLAEAETYFESRLQKTTWTAATDANKNIALVQSTRMLDEQLNWYGVPYSSTQLLRWPRYSVVDPDGEDVNYDSIPTFLKYATAEFAMQLLVADRQADDDTKGYKRLMVGTLRIDVDKFDRKKVMPKAVWNMVKFYGTKSSGGNKRLVRG